MMTLVFLVLSSLSSHALNSIAEICDSSHYAAEKACPADATCSDKANQCVTDCSKTSVNWDLTERRHVERQKNNCIAFVSGARGGADKALCEDAITALTACKSGCKSLYDSCLKICREKVTDATELAAVLARCDSGYTGKPIKAAGATPVSPIDEPKDEPKEEEETPLDPTDPPQNTGGTNTVAQWPILEGLGSSSYGDTSLSNDASAIDFSKGPTADAGGYRKASAGVANTSDAQGYVGSGHGNYDPELPSGELKGFSPSGNGGGNGGGSGGNGGGGSPPMSSMAGGGGNGGNPTNAARRTGGGGGNYRNGAADYLSRHSPFSFQSGGNSNAPGNNAKRAVAASPKKNLGPRYNKKENDGTDALHRLFGNGQTPSSYKRNPYAGGGACRDTVFCNMETFYNKIERLPNHDINPDSY